MAEEKTGIILLSREGIDVYIENFSDILHFPIPETLVQDMEVVNRDELINQISLFFGSNNITDMNFHMLVDDSVLFSKEFKNLPIDQQAEDIKSFIASIPFDYPITKQTKIKDGVIISATNRILIETITLGCQKSGNHVEIIAVAYLVLQGLDLTNGFTKQVGEAALKKTDQIKQASFFEDMPTSQAKNESDLPFYKKPQNKRAILLSIVFAILVIVLIIVYFISSSSNSSPQPKANTATTPTLAPQAPQATTSASLTNAAETKIQVRTNSLERFSEVQTTLNTLNFQMIELDTENTTLGEKTTIMFDPSVSQTLQQNISQAILTIDPETTTQVSPISPFHVIIILGQ